MGLYAYAEMSNHVHIVLHVDPRGAQDWPDEEVASRWVRLLPVRVDGTIDENACQEKTQRLQGDPERMAELRMRLGSLSWFMRCLNEPIARQANRRMVVRSGFGEDGSSAKPCWMSKRYWLARPTSTSTLFALAWRPAWPIPTTHRSVAA